MSAPLPPAKRLLLAFAALFALTAAAYLPALSAGYIWDDEQYVTHNVAVHAPNGLTKIWLDPWSVPQYYPVTMSSFWLENRIFGDRPGPHHATNVLLHALCAMVLWRLLWRLRVRGAWVAAAIFALHPVHVESVAWITERKNVLSGLFFLLSLGAWLRFAPPDAEQRGSRRWYAAALAAFVVALLSKTVAGSMPAVALLIVWWKRGRIRLRDVVPLLPFFVLALAAGSTTAYLEKHRVGAWGPDWDLSAAQRVLIAGRALWFYAGKLIVPAQLTFVYPRFQIVASQLLAWLWPAAAAATLAALWVLRARIGRGPLVACLYFAGVLVPALSFVNVFPMLYSFVADHFQYLASIGLIALAAAGGALACDRIPAGRTLARFVTAAVLATLAFLTWSQARIYHDVETLWRDTLAKNPAAWMARANLASLLHFRAAGIDDPEARRAGLQEAEREYRASLTLRPANLPARIQLSHLYEQVGDFERAHAELRAAAAQENGYPPGSRGYLQHANAWYELGRFLVARGDDAGAIDAFRRAVATRPDFEVALAAYGGALARSGDLEGAEVRLREALAVRPDAADPLNDLAGIYAGRGDLTNAIEMWSKALRSDPNHATAHTNLGAALVLTGRIDEGLPHLHRAVELDPDFALARRNLSDALHRLRKP